MENNNENMIYYASPAQTNAGSGEEEKAFGGFSNRTDTVKINSMRIDEFQNKLSQFCSNILKSVRSINCTCNSNYGEENLFELNEIEVAIQISAKGNFCLAEAGASSSITLKFKVKEGNEK